jgi:exosortase A
VSGFTTPEQSPMKRPTRKSLTSSWQTPIGLILLALTSYVLAYSSSLLSIVDFWLDSSDYSHGVLVPLISGYLIWMKKDALLNAGATPQPLGLFLLLIMSFFLLIAKTIDIQLIERIALISIFPVLVWTLLGNRATKIILFPLAFLIFATPIWNIFAVPLQEFTALASARILRVIGIPILLEEKYISIPSGVFRIEKACGGLRFFIATAAISSLYSYLNYQTLSTRLKFVVIALVGAVILNWVRVCSIIVIGHITNMGSSLVHDHANFGWWLFAGGMILLFYYGSTISEPDSVSLTPSKAAFVPQNNTSFTFVVITILALCSASLLTDLNNNQTNPKGIATFSAPIPPPPWKATIESNNKWVPNYIGASSYISSSNQLDGRIIYLHISSYSQQSQHAELINESNALYDSKSWKKTDEAVRLINLKNGMSIEIKEVLLENNGRYNRLIWFWYHVAGKNTTKPLTAKLLELRKLFGTAENSSVVALAIDYDESYVNPREYLSKFLFDTYEIIEASLRTK